MNLAPVFVRAPAEVVSASSIPSAACAIVEEGFFPGAAVPAGWCDVTPSAQLVPHYLRAGDFRVLASHQESLHSHDAVSLLTEGATFAQDSLDPHLFQTLIHAR